MQHGRPLALAAALMVAALGVSAGVEAKPPTGAEKALAGRAILSPKPFPPSFASEADFLRTMRRMDKKVFRPNAKGVWQIHYLAFFPVALDESSCQVHIFDITDTASGGKSKHVETNTELVGRRASRSLASTLTLHGPSFKPNRNYRVIIARSSDRGLLAKATFQLRARR